MANEYLPALLFYKKNTPLSLGQIVNADGRFSDTAVCVTHYGDSAQHKVPVLSSEATDSGLCVEGLCLLIKLSEITAVV